MGREEGRSGGGRKEGGKNEWREREEREGGMKGEKRREGKKI